MTSRAIKPRRDDMLLPVGGEPIAETAPSIERDDQQILPRMLGMAGVMLVVVCAVAMRWSESPIGRGWGALLGGLGLLGLIYHVFSEGDRGIRMVYLAGSALLAALGLFFSFGPAAEGWGSYFYTGGVPALVMALVGAYAVARRPLSPEADTFAAYFLAGLGGVMIAVGIFGGLARENFLLGQGGLLLLLGLSYVAGFIALCPRDSGRAFTAGLVLGGVGLFAIFTALVKSLLPESHFLVPDGILLMGLGALYLGASLAVCSDWAVIVIARRELAAYFTSPIAYLALTVMVLLGWGMFYFFVDRIVEFGPRGVLFEPIIVQYIVEIFPVFAQMFIVPIITMRLLSEERRTGTLEVLLVAPVNEVSVVLGKFLAVWIFHAILWLPPWLYLLSLRYFGTEFDYLPLFSYGLAMGAISAGMLSIGLFCSSLTSNQIIAAVFTFIVMVLYLAIFFLRNNLRNSPIVEVLDYLDFVSLWIRSLAGTVAPRYLIVHVSIAVFFLFATVQVLSARKWK